MKNKTVVYFMRHGLDDESFVGGWSNGNLTDEGKLQVEKSADFIVQNIKDINIIYHSGLNRTIETTNIINEKLKLPVFENKDLRELNKGILNGMKVDLAKGIYPKYFPNPLINERYPNGESLQDLYERVIKFLDKIDNYDKSLLVTHRGFINMVYFILNNINLNYNKTQFNVTHGSIHKLELKKIKRIYGEVNK
ncbi:MAG: phosphoglycerate mutase family protein [Bacilli bacterium]|nr:phosphoglycerate mutase family protein [Bacilli bacterium]